MEILEILLSLILIGYIIWIFSEILEKAIFIIAGIAGSFVVFKQYFSKKENATISEIIIGIVLAFITPLIVKIFSDLKRKKRIEKDVEQKTNRAFFVHPNEVINERMLRTAPQKKEPKISIIINRFERLRPWLSPEKWTEDKKILIPTFIELSKVLIKDISEYEGADKTQLEEIEKELKKFITLTKKINRK